MYDQNGQPVVVEQEPVEKEWPSLRERAHRFFVDAYDIQPDGKSKLLQECRKPVEAEVKEEDSYTSNGFSLFLYSSSCTVPEFRYWTESLFRFVASANEEAHDVIVYMLGREFDRNDPCAVVSIAEMIVEAVNIFIEGRKTPQGERAKHTVPCTTSVEYQQYIANGNQPNETIMKSIQYRENRERMAAAEGMLYVPFSEGFATVVRRMIDQARTIRFRRNGSVRWIDDADALLWEALFWDSNFY